MKIRCWGARGSIPVSGREYLRYGGDTTCLEIRTADDEIIIIDAGTGIRGLGAQLLAENRFRYNMFITHSHWDHILGFPFFKPIYRRETSIRIFGCHASQESIKNMLSKVMAAPNFPVDFKDVRAEISYQEECSQDIQIQSTAVTPIALSHPNPGSGYKFVERGKSFVFLTDNELRYRHPEGLGFADYVRFCAGAELLIHDSEFTEEEYQAKRTWGHSSYRDALQLALEARVKRFGLYHHNQERTDDQIDAIVQDCREIVAARKADLECFAVAQGMELEL
jgi:phosphoribosyl 1,2-cyclic phosphodiesterase